MSIDISAGKRLLKNKGITTNDTSLERVLGDEEIEGIVETYMNTDIHAGIRLLKKKDF